MKNINYIIPNSRESSVFFAILTVAGIEEIFSFVATLGVSTIFGETSDAGTLLGF